MRIGIDIRNIGKQRTGDETVFFNLVKNLAEIDNSNEYLLFTDIAGENIIQELKKKLAIENKENFKIIFLNCPNKFVWNIWTLPAYLRKSPVDVYHTQYITPFFVSKNIKIVTHIHDISFLAYPEFIKKSDLFFLKNLIPGSIRRADKVIAVSEFTKNEIIKYYKTDPGKIKVVYNAVGEDFLKSDYSGSELFEIRKKYNLPEEFILYIGTLQPRKNIPILIQSFARIKEKIPEVKLVLAGNRNAHNFDDDIDNKIEELKISGSIIFPGFVDEEDKSALFQLAKAFVFPSLYEGFGIPILEAFASRVPVLTSDIPVHNEIIQNAAVFFDPESLDDLSEKLYNSLVNQNLRDNLIDLGFQRVKFFSWKKSSEKMLEIYRELI